MVVIPKGVSPISAQDALKSLKQEFLPPEKERKFLALDSVLETLKELEHKK